MPRPRVISEFIPSPLSSPLAASLRIPAIVGEGATSFVRTRQITRGTGATDSLVDFAIEIIRVGLFSSTTDFSEPTDYVLTNGEIDWSPGGAEPAAGQRYFVTYRVAKTAADFEPKLFDNFDAILTEYGPVTVTGTSLDAASYLTMAAQLMMGPGIGATRLIVAQVQAATPGSPTPSEFQAALDKLREQVGGRDPYYVTPLIGRVADASVPQVNAAFLNHSIQMADEQFRKERRAYLGLKSNSSFSAVVATAQSLGIDTNASRATLLANFDPIVSIALPTGSVDVVLDGSFVAAAIAGFRSTQQVSQPVLNKLIPAFKGFATRFNSVQIDDLDDAGAMVLEEVAGTVRSVNGVTVRVVNDIEKSIPTVETRDILIQELRRRLAANFLGLRGSPSIPAQIEDSTDNFLEERRSSGDIQAFSPSRASRVPNTISQFVVAFSYFPAGEVLEIKVRFSIDLNLI